MKLVLICAGMGKHNAKPKYEFFSRIREASGNFIPFLPIIVVGAGMAAAIYEPSMRGYASSQFVRACGATLCRGSAVFTPLPRVACSDELGNPAAIINAAREGNQNTIEIGSLVTPSQKDDEELIAEGTWKKVDAVIARAEEEHYPVILNLGDFVTRRSVSDEQISSITEWKNFLTFVSNRPNSITHKAYADDQTIIAIDLDHAPECTDADLPLGSDAYDQVISLAQDAFKQRLIMKESQN